jgi:hypothetical protein
LNFPVKPLLCAPRQSSGSSNPMNQRYGFVVIRGRDSRTIYGFRDDFSEPKPIFPVR